MGIIWEMIESESTTGNNCGNTTLQILHYWSETRLLVIRNIIEVREEDFLNMAQTKPYKIKSKKTKDKTYPQQTEENIRV